MTSCPGFPFLLYAGFVFFVLKLFSLFLQNVSLPSVCECVRLFVLRVCSDGRMEPRCHLVRTIPDANLPLQQGGSRWGAEQDIVAAPVQGVRADPLGSTRELEAGAPCLLNRG